MPSEFKLQDPGEGIHEAKIVELNVSEGDEVSDGDVLMTVETDKAAVEVPSPFDGRIEKIHVSEGETARVGDVVLTYHEKGEEGDAAAEDEPDTDEDEPDSDEDGDPDPGEDDEAGDSDPENGERGEESSSEGDGRPVPASPATRRRARELGVELDQVEGSGPEGRVTTDDVEAEAGADGEDEEEERRADGESEDEDADGGEEGRARDPDLPDFSRWGETEREALTGPRQAIAEKMSLSWSRVPHVTHQDVADITELEAFREEHSQAVEEGGGKLTLTVLVLKAVVGALREFPRFNASLDAEAGELVLKRYVHVGIAVDTDAGLLVPVVRDVDRKTIAELAKEVVEISDRARAGELEPGEMQGGSFTVTNPGPLGGTGFTPIINHPEVAILGMARADRVPAIGEDGESVVARLRLPLCLAFDHRVIDGADAARFLSRVIETLEDPSAFILHT